MSAHRLFDKFKTLLDVTWGSIADSQLLQRSGSNIIGADIPPIGSVIDFAGSSAPAGWLLCDGSSLLRAGTYAALFAVIGVVYGSVDGTHFTLPDMRGRVGAGKDNMGGSAASRLTTAWGVDGITLGANGGTESHVLTTPQIPAHTHSFVNPAGVVGGALASGAAYTNQSQTSGSTGGGLAHPNVQPTLILNKIIKY